MRVALWRSVWVSPAIVRVLSSHASVSGRSSAPTCSADANEYFLAHACCRQRGDQADFINFGIVEPVHEAFFEVAEARAD